MSRFRILLGAWLLISAVMVMAADPQDPAALMDDAKQAMKEAQYNRAIQSYLQLLALPDNAYRRDALELLALAYERNGQLDQAKREYERYLQLYPDGEGAERVRQRLAGIVTAAWPEQDATKKLRPEKQAQRSEWQFYGSLSQYLRRDVSQFEDQPSVVGNYSLTTALDVTSKGRSGDLEVKTRVAGSYLYDIDNIRGHEQQLSYLYLDLNQRSQGWSASLGRQRANGGGVLGRYDGIDLAMRVTPRSRVGVVAGIPVDRTTDLSPDSSRRFYGLNIETGPWNEYWELNGYLIQQEAEGFLDRQAAGAELRYLHPERILYTLLDYDVSYDTLNIASVQGTWIMPDKTSYNLLLDYRNGPSMATRNALFGQSVTTLTELSLSKSEEQMREMAQSVTPRTTLGMVGVSHPLSERYRLDADLSVTSIGATPGTDGVLATESSGNDYYLSTQLTGLGFFKAGDVTIFGLRFGDSAVTRSTTLLTSSRLPFGTRWSVNPRLQLGYQKYVYSSESQQNIFPSVRLEYNWNRLSNFWFDGGYDWSRRDLWSGKQDYTNYYLELGYRLGF